MREFVKAFSFPRGIGSHAHRTTGVSTMAASSATASRTLGAAFDNPDLLGPSWSAMASPRRGRLATRLDSNKFLNPVRDGACCQCCT